MLINIQYKTVFSLAFVCIRPTYQIYGNSQLQIIKLMTYMLHRKKIIRLGLYGMS